MFAGYRQLTAQHTMSVGYIHLLMMLTSDKLDENVRAYGTGLRGGVLLSLL